MTFRVLLSCASELVYADLYQPGEFPLHEAQALADRIMSVSPGVEAYVVPTGNDAREVLHERGLL